MVNCDNCRASGICEGIVGDCEQTDKIAGKIYQRGKADAIDEYMESLCKKLEECQTGFNMVSMANIWYYSRDIAEQLKEQQ